MYANVNLTANVKVAATSAANAAGVDCSRTGDSPEASVDSVSNGVDSDREAAEQIPEKFIPERHRRPELHSSATRRVLRDSWEEEVDEEEVKAEQDDFDMRDDRQDDRRDEDIRGAAYQCLLRERGGPIQLTELGVMIRSRLGCRVYGLKKVLEDDPVTFGITNPRPSLFLVRLTAPQQSSVLTEVAENTCSREQHSQQQFNSNPVVDRDVYTAIRDHATSILLASPHHEAPLTAIGQSLMSLNLRFDGKIKDVLFSFPDVFALTRVGTTHWKVKLIEPAAEIRATKRPAENSAPPSLRPSALPPCVGCQVIPCSIPQNIPNNAPVVHGLSNPPERTLSSSPTHETRDAIRSFLRTEPDLEATVREIRNHIAGTGCIRNNESAYYAIKRYPNDFQLFKVDGEDWCARLILDGGNTPPGCPRRIEEAVIEVLTQERRELKGNELSRILADLYGIWCHNLRRLLESSSTRPSRFKINFMPRDATKWSIKLTRGAARAAPAILIRSTDYSRGESTPPPGFSEKNGMPAGAREYDRNNASLPGAQCDVTHNARQPGSSHKLPLAPGPITLPTPQTLADIHPTLPSTRTNPWARIAADNLQPVTSAVATTSSSTAPASPFSYFWTPMLPQPVFMPTSEAPRPARPLQPSSSSALSLPAFPPPFTATTHPPFSGMVSPSSTIPSSPWSNPPPHGPGRGPVGSNNLCAENRASACADMRMPGNKSKQPSVASLSLLKQLDDTAFDEISSSVAHAELRSDAPPFLPTPGNASANGKMYPVNKNGHVCDAATSSTVPKSKPSPGIAAMTRFIRLDDYPARTCGVALAEVNRNSLSPVRSPAAEANSIGSASELDDGGKSDSGESSTVVVHAREGTSARAEGLTTADSAVFESAHGHEEASLSVGPESTDARDVGLDVLSMAVRGTTVFVGDRRSGKTRSIHAAVRAASDYGSRGHTEVLAVYRDGDITAEGPSEGVLFCRALDLPRGAEITVLVSPGTLDDASRLYAAGSPGKDKHGCNCAVVPIIFSVADLRYDDVLGFLGMADFDLGFAALVEHLLCECFERQIWIECADLKSTPGGIGAQRKVGGPPLAGYWTWDYFSFREKLLQLALTRGTKRDHALIDARAKGMAKFLYEAVVEKIFEGQTCVAFKAVDDCTSRRFLSHSQRSRIIAVDLRNPNLPDYVASTVISMIIRQWANDAGTAGSAVRTSTRLQASWDRWDDGMRRLLVFDALDTYIDSHPAVLRSLRALSRSGRTVAGNLGVLVESCVPQPWLLSSHDRVSSTLDERGRTPLSASWRSLGSILQLSDAVVIHRCSAEAASDTLSWTGAASQAHVQEAGRWAASGFAAGGPDLGSSPRTSLRCSLPPPLLTGSSMEDSGIADGAWSEDEVLVWCAPERWTGGSRYGSKSFAPAGSLRRVNVP